MREAEYGVEVAKVLFADIDHFDVQPDGVRTAPSLLAQFHEEDTHWTPACDLQGDDAPDPLAVAALPIPFNARQLAAYLLAGPGAWIPAQFGDMSGEPSDEDMRAQFGIRAVKVRAALKEAYTAYRSASSRVGWRPDHLAAEARDLAALFLKENGKANEGEKLYERGISEEERQARRDRASRSVSALRERRDEAQERLRAAMEDWRIAMVNELLVPTAPRSLRIALQTADPIGIDVAKQLLLSALPPEHYGSVIAYPDEQGNISDASDFDINPEFGTGCYALFLNKDLAQIFKDLAIRPRMKWRPIISTYRGPEDDASYVIDVADFAKLAQLYGVAVDIGRGESIATTTATAAPIASGAPSLAVESAPETQRVVVRTTKTARRDTLTPVVEQAMGKCKDPADAAAVWGQLLVLAEKQEAPLLGATEEGIQYLKDGRAEILTRDALRKRIARKSGAGR